jgi:hypothetical protein
MALLKKSKYQSRGGFHKAIYSLCLKFGSAPILLEQIYSKGGFYKAIYAPRLKFALCAHLFSLI